MIKKFYYFRDVHGRPMVTLCKLIHDGDVGYGWAICSRKDNPCKKVGQKIAFSRANTAMLEGQGKLLDDSQHIFCWKRPIVCPEAVLMLGANNPLYNLSVEKSTAGLPLSMRV